MKGLAPSRGQNEVIFGNLVKSSDESAQERQRYMYLMKHCTCYDMRLKFTKVKPNMKTNSTKLGRQKA